MVPRRHPHLAIPPQSARLSSATPENLARRGSSSGGSQFHPPLFDHHPLLPLGLRLLPPHHPLQRQVRVQLPHLLHPTPHLQRHHNCLPPRTFTLFANLQSLCIRDSEANVIEGVVAAVAPTLEELTLAGVGELPKERARALSTALHGALGSVARLRSLKRLELSDGWPYNQPTLREIDDGDELQDECARKGVEVVLDDGMV